MATAASEHHSLGTLVDKTAFLICPVQVVAVRASMPQSRRETQERSTCHRRDDHRTWLAWLLHFWPMTHLPAMRGRAGQRAVSLGSFPGRQCYRAQLLFLPPCLTTHRVRMHTQLCDPSSSLSWGKQGHGAAESAQGHPRTVREAPLRASARSQGGTAATESRSPLSGSGKHPGSGRNLILDVSFAYSSATHDSLMSGE